MTDNTEKKGNTNRKNPWRFLFVLCALYGALELLGSAAAWFLCYTSVAPGFSAGGAASIGIIGGADGPTAVFVTTPGWTGYIVPVLCLLIGICGFLWLHKSK